MHSNLQALGKHGVAAIEQAVSCGGGPSGGKLRLLTHCNTGSLATAAYGTALGVVRALAEAGRLEHAFCTETRPYNQGEFSVLATLAFELNAHCTAWLFTGLQASNFSTLKTSLR